MKVVIVGGTGLIGRALAESLLRDGHEVDVVSRNPNAHVPGGAVLARWDGRSASDWGRLIDGADAVVNLAGENLSSGRWTPRQKQVIRESRVNAGNAIVQAFQEAQKKPRVLVQISGVGAYGTSEKNVFSETDPYGDDFLSSITRDWEASTLPVEHLGVRRVIARSGVVFSREAGAFPRLLLPFKFFLGGPLGSGRQWLSWIHLEDEVRALRFLIENEQAAGIFNVAATPVTNREFAHALGEQMHRPAFFAVPSFMIRLLLGEMAVMVLEGQNVSNAKLTGLGLTLKYATAVDALSALMGKQV